ncbi:hypothetical protein BO71DRAFT_394474 [Aspergillus ellipticus CBS 707.79]|uniref:Uncharacterized protein n=1 Tax=Aspergillus ellipticus CBS 707.79 TaxID=1448320 RepID=A0A319EF22_9EURO|nr:hypothetical protein BO71DRAFT_394474 [Aspergillus ellipticus CBS 707.79]
MIQPYPVSDAMDPLKMYRPLQTTDPSLSSSPPSRTAPALSDPGHEILLIDGADTLVYIDPKSFKPAWTLQPQSAASIPHRVISHNLLDTGSPYFVKAFEPRRVSRTIKRRGLDGALPEGIKYVIDLTPPPTDDEAILFTTELSCPLGIRTWARSMDRWSLPSQFVGGIDEGQDYSRETTLPVEYSDSRHRKGIVDILKALHQIDPGLDTPCKLWTFFALAKVFGIGNEARINDHILTWVYESTNAKIIELHPEVTFRIACGVQCVHMCRDSFSILVGEEALLRLADVGKEPRLQRPQKTFHGRIRELLDDDDYQRVEYAGQNMMEHIIEQFIDLAGAEMAWLPQLPAYQSIQAHVENKCGGSCNLASELMAILKEYVRGHIFAILANNATVLPKEKRQYIGTDEYPSQDFANACNSMRLTERIMSKSFWKTVVPADSHTDSLASPGAQLGGRAIADVGKPLYPFLAQGDAKIGSVDLSDLLSVVNQYNRHIDPSIPRFGFRKLSLTSLIEPRGMRRPDRLRQLDPHGNTHWPGTISWEYVSTAFDPMEFINQAGSYMAIISERMNQTTSTDAQFVFTDTLTCLTENEIKFLPLWAGGNDDGSGGVYMGQVIPHLETGGFSTPGPGIHTGSTVVSSTASFSSAGTSEYESTAHGASHRATAGHWTDVMSVGSGAASISSGELIDKDEFSLNMDTSAGDEEGDCFDSDSEGDSTVILGPSSTLDPIEEVAEKVEHLDLGVEALSD